MKISVKPSARVSSVSDIIGVGMFEAEKSAFDAQTQKHLEKIKFTGKSGETFFLPGSLAKSKNVVMLVGLGKKDLFTLEKIRRAAAKLVSQAKSFRFERAEMGLDTFRGKFSIEEAAAAVVEGARLSDYSFDKYKSKKTPARKLEELSLSFKDSGKIKPVLRALEEAETVVSGVVFTRDVANEPPNVMTPSKLAQTAKEMAAKNNLSCKVLGKNEIKRLGMGGILGVSQGSAEEPKFIILENKVAKPKFKSPIVLVGKGITFDTGGISIKPASDMDKMKFDMCGAAAVIGAMKVIANLKLPIKVIGLTPVCENMPDGRAQRPGDIIRCLNGKTVEVLNTDAEGRLILADALGYAARYKPKAIIDIATLTGACAVTFADLAIGLMGTDSELVDRIKKAGEYTGERCWELPLWEEYGELIKAAYADIQNISKKYAGTITAGMFLKEFADHTKTWAHLDVAGTAWNDGGPKPLSPIGATGVCVRLFVKLLKDYLK